MIKAKNPGSDLTFGQELSRIAIYGSACVRMSDLTPDWICLSGGAGPYRAGEFLAGGVQ